MANRAPADTAIQPASDEQTLHSLYLAAAKESGSSLSAADSFWSSLRPAEYGPATQDAYDAHKAGARAYGLGLLSAAGILLLGFRVFAEATGTNPSASDTVAASTTLLFGIFALVGVAAVVFLCWIGGRAMEYRGSLKAWTAGLGLAGNIVSTYTVVAATLLADQDHNSDGGLLGLVAATGAWLVPLFLMNVLTLPLWPCVACTAGNSLVVAVAWGSQLVSPLPIGVCIILVFPHMLHIKTARQADFAKQIDTVQREEESAAADAMKSAFHGMLRFHGVLDHQCKNRSSTPA